MDFDWSFRPILNWMRILGIELGHSEVNYSTLRRCGMLVFGLFMLTINIASNIIQTTWELPLTKEQLEAFGYKNVGSTWNFRRKIKSILSLIECSGIHVTLLSRVIFQRWDSLWNCIYEVEHEFNFDVNVYKKCRNISVLGLSVLILVILITKPFLGKHYKYIF